MFKLNILVNNGAELEFRWKAKELNNIEAVEDRFIAELEAINPGLFDEWEVVEDKDAPFWAKSPVDAVHKLEGNWGGDWSHREIFHDHLLSDRMMIRRWLQASEIVLIADERGLNSDVLLWFAFKGGQKDPIAFAKEVSLEAEIEEFWKFFDDQD